MTKLLLIAILAITIIVTIAADCKHGNLIIKQGQDGYPKDECIRVHCIDGTKTAAIPCPQIGIPHGCKVKYEGIDLSKQYPDCCGKAYCES